MRINPINNIVSYKSRDAFKPLVQPRSKISALRYAIDKHYKLMYTTEKTTSDRMSEKEKYAERIKQFNKRTRDNIEYLESKGYKVRKKLDDTLAISSDKTAKLSAADLGNFNISEIDGDAEITFSHIMYLKDIPLEKVKGRLTIKSDGEEQSSSSSLFFPRLKETGSLKINNALYMDFSSLKHIHGNFQSSKVDSVILKNIQSIEGDFNVLSGDVQVNKDIFKAVQGKMNRIPPETESNVYLDSSNEYLGKLTFYSNGNVYHTHRIKT